MDGHPPIEEVMERYGFDPRDRAARSWLWATLDDGRLMVIAGAGETFDEPNYDGNAGPMVGGPAYAQHFWKSLAPAP